MASPERGSYEVNKRGKNQSYMCINKNIGNSKRIPLKRQIPAFWFPGGSHDKRGNTVVSRVNR